MRRAAVAGLTVATIIAVATVLLPLAPTQAAHAQAQPACTFVLGFAILRALIPPQVGNCLENQRFAANGDAQQRATGGLLAWRKNDNWTAFTDGYRTWINGPKGLQQRLNTERFSWEGDAGAEGTTVVAEAPPVPVAAPAPPASVGDDQLRWARASAALQGAASSALNEASTIDRLYRQGGAGLLPTDQVLSALDRLAGAHPTIASVVGNIDTPDDLLPVKNGVLATFDTNLAAIGAVQSFFNGGDPRAAAAAVDRALRTSSQALSTAQAACKPGAPLCR